MKKIMLGLVAASMVFSAGAFAQPAAPVPPAAAGAAVQANQPEGQAEWAALMKKQAAARKALNDQLKVERDAFLKAHPALAARLEEQMKAARERFPQRGPMHKPVQPK